MGSDKNVPVDLYIAAYPTAEGAQADWDGVKQLAEDDVIKVVGLVLVSRGADGKINVDDDFHTARKGAAWGAVGGAVIGLIFPPSLLASAAVGAGAGLGIGSLKSHRDKKAIKADVEDSLPPNSSGIVVLFEEIWLKDIEKALSHADKVSKHEVDADSAAEVENAVK